MVPERDEASDEVFGFRVFGRIAVLLAIANFSAFMVANVTLGGDAPNGRIDGHRYYVGDRGKYTEVSEAQFRYSEWHAGTLCITHGLGFLGGLILLAIRDPLATRRYTKGNRSVLGVLVASIVLGFVGAKTIGWLAFLVFPLAVAAGVFMELGETPDSESAR